MPPFYPDIVNFLGRNASGKNPPLPSVDMSGKTIVVTGANTGLGLDACKHLFVIVTTISVGSLS
jgi:hypothetical protein